MANPDPNPKPIGKLPEAEIPKARQSLPLTWGHFITGDFAGLYALAGDLYDFASKCNGEVNALSRYVDRLVGEDHEKWHGETALLFKASYGQDAVMMNGMNRVVAAVAAVVDDLVAKLARLEYVVEQKVDIAVNSGFVRVSPDGDATEVIGVPGKPAAVYNELDSFITKARVQAQKVRMQAATKLVSLGAALSSGLNYYSGNAGKPGSLDPNGLLSAQQQANDSLSVKRLQAQLKKEAAEIGASPADVKENFTQLKKMHGDAEKIGKVLGDIKNGKNLVDVVTTVGPVIEDLGGEIGIAALAIG